MYSPVAAAYSPAPMGETPVPMGETEVGGRSARAGSGGLELTATASLRKVIDTSVRGILIVDQGGTVRYAST